MKNRRNVFSLIWVSLLMILSVCFIFRPIIGERLALKVKDKDGGMSKIYLKANADYVALSEVPNMRGWWDDSLTAIPDGLIFLYKNTIDTLYVVWFETNPPKPPLETSVNIIFIYEPGYNPQLVASYISNGFKLFPKSHYQ